MKSKRIIIIGGMGPQASISLHERLLRRASELGAKNGHEYPEITHLSLPIEDFISNRSKTSQALEIISQRLAYLWLLREQYKNRYSM